MDMHKFIIGIIFTVIGVIFGIILLDINARFATVDVSTTQQAVFPLMVAIAALQLVAGYRIIFDRSWCSRLNVFIAAFNLVIFPFGTFAGVYYFWYYLKSNFTQHRYHRHYSP